MEGSDELDSSMQPGSDMDQDSHSDSESSDGYGDHELSELEGEELQDSLRVRMEGEIEELERLDTPQPTAYAGIMQGISTHKW